MKINSSEKGQALIVITFAAVVLFAFAGLAIDGGRKFSEQRHAQNAADTSVMTAVLAVCRGRDAAAAGLAMANTNGFNNNGTSNWVTVSTPPASGTYAGQSGYVEVIVQSHVQPTFGRVVYNGPLKVYARAIARCGTTTSTSSTSISYNPNVFRGVWTGASSGCSNQDDYFHWGGSNNVINGGIHSNQDIYISGSGSPGNFVNGPSTVAGDLLGGGSATFVPPLVEGSASLSDPFAGAGGYSFSRFINPSGDIYIAASAVNRIVITNGKIEAGWLKSGACIMDGEPCYNDSTHVLQDGIYVTTYTGSDAIKIDDMHGAGSGFANVTFVTNTGGIDLASSNKLNPYIGNENAEDSNTLLQGLHGILAATWRQEGSNQCTSPVIYISGSNQQLGGILYAPKGQVELPGSTNIINGCMMGNTASLNGSNNTITCDGTWFPQSQPEYFVSLIE